MNGTTKRYWDGEHGYVDCVVVWNGRGPMPHEEDNARFWAMRQNATLEAAPGRTGFISQWERPGADLPARTPSGHLCRCGRSITAKSWALRQRHCARCRHKRTEAKS